MTEALIKASAVTPNELNFVTSAPVEGSWGQPPASYYIFTNENGVIRGRFASRVFQRFPSSDSARTRYDETLSPEIEALLNRTIKEHYDLWAELAKR